MSNAYLQEVISNQTQVQKQLQQPDLPTFLAEDAVNVRPGRMRLLGGDGPTHHTPVASTSQIRVVRYPCLPWQHVIVPPHFWIVHTRRGHPAPLTCSLGTSITFWPRSDAFLCAPATVQTLMINATTITLEKQGCVVQAYLQYAIKDFEQVYKTVDISSLSEPFRIVNVQLQEQTQATIKDVVATMSIDQVLTDKRNIIEELTSRLQSVTKAQGLEVIQVQIKEAVVSSNTLFEALQRPFREEKARIAKISALEAKRAVEEAEIEAKSKTDKLRRLNEVETAMERAKLEGARVDAEMKQIAAQRELDRARAEAAVEVLQRDLARRKQETEADVERQLALLKVKEAERALDNSVSEARLQEVMLRSLPEVVGRMPKPDKLEVVHLNGGGGGTVESVVALQGVVKAMKEVWKAAA